MGNTFGDKAEEEELFRQKLKDNSALIFNALHSAGRNSAKLAQLLASWDFIINIMGWQDKPLANLTKFVANYQASVDAKYHDDFKEIQIALEIERRREQRKGLSILQQ